MDHGVLPVEYVGYTGEPLWCPMGTLGGLGSSLGLSGCDRRRVFPSFFWSAALTLGRGRFSSKVLCFSNIFNGNSFLGGYMLKVLEGIAFLKGFGDFGTAKVDFNEIWSKKAPQRHPN